MFEFMGIQFGGNGYKVQQLVYEEGRLVTKTSDVEFWIVSSSSNGTLYTPISKLDRQTNRIIVPSQVINSFNEHGRMILKKTSKGLVTIPFGGILQR